MNELEEIREIVREKNANKLFILLKDMDSFIVASLHMDRKLHDKFLENEFSIEDVENDIDELVEVIRKNLALLEEEEKKYDYVEYDEMEDNEIDSGIDWREESLVDFYRELETKRYREISPENWSYKEVSSQDLNY